ELVVRLDEEGDRLRSLRLEVLGARHDRPGREDRRVVGGRVLEERSRRAVSKGGRSPRRRAGAVPGAEPRLAPRLAAEAEDVVAVVELVADDADRVVLGSVEQLVVAVLVVRAVVAAEDAGADLRIADVGDDRRRFALEVVTRQRRTVCTRLDALQLAG